MWLPCYGDPNTCGERNGSRRGEKAGLETDMQHLRRGDVVVVRNMALACFRGRVYGQSLRRGYTRVEVVWSVGRGKRCRDVESLDGAVREKLARVRRWAVEFVGGPGAGGAGDEGRRARGHVGRSGAMLPPDTQSP